MKYIAACLLLLPQFAPAQELHFLNIPEAETGSSGSIAAYISKNTQAEKDRISAAYYWITKHIRYDTDSLYYFNWNCDHDTRVAATIRRRKGVCENYAALFSDILSKMNIQSFVVHGYGKQSGMAGHAWVAVKQENEWLLCDPTWDAGHEPAKYFMTEPAVFIDRHMPYDPLWQLLPQPLTHREYKRGIGTSSKNKTPWNIKDSIIYFLALDSMQRFEAANRRIAAAGLDDEMINQWHKYNSMKIAIIRGEKYMYMYNNAVACINKATAALNKFIVYRNEQFRPSKPDAAISLMLGDAEAWLKQAQQQINELAAAKDNFQYDPEGLQQQHATIIQKLRLQQEFLNRYLLTNPAVREKLFYRQ
ncbi:MAG: transglutaminase-like domain-containing protein [Ferruginibacter sp.]